MIKAFVCTTHTHPSVLEPRHPGTMHRRFLKSAITDGLLMHCSRQQLELSKTYRRYLPSIMCAC